MSLVSNVLTRRPLADDAAAIRRVHIAAGKGPDSLERDNPNVLKWLDSRTEEDYLDEMKREQFVLAEAGGVVCGFGAINLGKKEITSVYVDPAYTRKGVASALVAEMERIAVDAGLAAVELQAAGGALDFYHKQGFSYVTEPPAEGPKWAQMRKQLSV